jgi:hypothetical protein
MRCVPPSSPRSEHHLLLLVLLMSCRVFGLAVPHETLKSFPERGDVGHEGLKRPAIHRQDIDVGRRTDRGVAWPLVEQGHLPGPKGVRNGEYKADLNTGGVLSTRPHRP